MKSCHLYLESIILSEMGQSEKDKYHMVSLTCGIQKKTTKKNKQKKMQNWDYKYKEQTDGWQRGDGGEVQGVGDTGLQLGNE